MRRTALIAATLAVLGTPALAQAVVETPNSTTVVVPPGSPGVVTRQGGATGDGYAGSYSPTGRPEDNISPNSAASGNAGQPERLGSQGGGGR